MLRDAEYFKSRIGGLDGAAETAEYFVTIVEAKSVPKPKAPTPPPPPPVESPAEAEPNGVTEPVEEAKSTTDDKVPDNGETTSEKLEATWKGGLSFLPQVRGT